jgi:hypothetical protein
MVIFLPGCRGDLRHQLEKFEGHPTLKLKSREKLKIMADGRCQTTGVNPNSQYMCELEDVLR